VHPISGREIRGLRALRRKNVGARQDGPVTRFIAKIMQFIIVHRDRLFLFPECVFLFGQLSQ